MPKKPSSKKKADKAFVEKISSITVGTGANDHAQGMLGDMPVTITPPVALHEYNDIGLGVGVVHCEHGNPIGVAIGPIKKCRKPHDDSGEVAVTE